MGSVSRHLFERARPLRHEMVRRGYRARSSDLGDRADHCQVWRRSIWRAASKFKLRHTGPRAHLDTQADRPTVQQL